MGDPKRPISRSSGSGNLATVQKITKGSKVGLEKPNISDRSSKKRKGKKGLDKAVKEKVVKDILEIGGEIVEGDPEETFRQNIIEQTKHVSEEADALFKSGEHKKVSPKPSSKQELINKKSIPKKEVSKDEVEDTVDGSIDELKDFLGGSTKSNSELIVGVKHSPIPDMPLSKIPSKPYYDYGKVDSSTISFLVSPIKEINVRPLLDDPGVLYEGDFIKSRAFYVKKVHPLYNKVVKSFGDTVGIVHIRHGMLNDIIFGKVFKKIYDCVDGVVFDPNSYNIYFDGDKAEVVMAEAVIDYTNTAYYVFLEKLHEHEIHNMILINVDILFTI